MARRERDARFSAPGLIFRKRRHEQKADITSAPKSGRCQNGSLPAEQAAADFLLLRRRGDQAWLHFVADSRLPSQAGAWAHSERSRKLLPRFTSRTLAPMQELRHGRDFRSSVTLL